MKAALIKTVAVACVLAVLGFATLQAQTPDAWRRPEPNPAGLPILRIVTVQPKPAHKEETARKKQVTSEWSRTVDYSGPRFGFTYLTQEIVDSLKNHDIDVDRAISQFGWQLEHEIHVTPDGPMVLNEWVFLAGGLEKGVFLPSLTWLVGARSRSGNEVGFGPNVSIAGVGLALAAGVTANSGGLHVPMNVAAASSKGGIRVSFLTGFSLH
jgi:hypothetical protein